MKLYIHPANMEINVFKSKFFMSLREVRRFFFHIYYIEYWSINLSAEVKIETQNFQNFFPPVNMYLNVEMVQSKAQCNLHHASSWSVT